MIQLNPLVLPMFFPYVWVISPSFPTENGPVFPWKIPSAGGRDLCRQALSARRSAGGHLWRRGVPGERQGPRTAMGPETRDGTVRGAAGGVYNYGKSP